MKHAILATIALLWIAGCGGESGSDGDAGVDSDADAVEDAGEDAVDDADSGNTDAADAVDEPPPFDGTIVDVTIGSEVIAEVDPRFLSFAVDSSQVVGGFFWDPDAMGGGGGIGSTRVPPYDFDRPRLRRMAAELAPGFVRIGGTEADVVYYDLSDDPVEEAPEPYEWVLTRAMWEGLTGFADEFGFDLMFTLNAGPGPRDADRVWTPDNARPLVELAVSRGDPVEVWELGNEINGYPLNYGLDFVISGSAYVEDLRGARAMLDEVAPGALLAGPSSAFWPISGEPNAIFPAFAAATEPRLPDVVTWHFYPQMSRRCPVQARPAGPTVMLDPRHLDDVARWASQVETGIAETNPDAIVWLGETGNAYCGGEPDVSDTFASSFWWLDELGLMARRGQQVVVRQNLSGADYALIDEETLEPNPDYWASVLWQRTMGPRVLAADAQFAALRSYAHCGVEDGVSVVLIHLSQSETIAVDLGGAETGGAEVLVVTADALQGRVVSANGTVLTTADDGAPPELPWAPVAGGRVVVPPLSYAVVRLPEASCP